MLLSRKLSETFSLPMSDKPNVYTVKPRYNTVVRVHEFKISL